jgi:hypothetical protein
MNKRTLALVMGGLALVALGLGAHAQALPPDDELLAALDAARFTDSEVNSLKVRIQSVTPDETREATLSLRFATIEGADRARIEFLEPAELAGQIYLSTPDATYFFGPDLDFPIKTSATAEVFGDAAVAQTSGIRYLGKYTVADRRVVTDGAQELWELDLAAVDFSVAFQAITVRIDPSTLRPLYATLYALSGFPFYDVAFPEYATRESGDTYVRTQVITNRLFAGRVTTSETLEATVDNLPDSLFDPSLLGASGG